jgi:hypothetical protein
MGSQRIVGLVTGRLSRHTLPESRLWWDLRGLDTHPDRALHFLTHGAMLIQMLKRRGPLIEYTTRGAFALMIKLLLA